MWFRTTRQAPLHVLNVWLDPGQTALMVVCELCHGSDPVETYIAPAAEFGIASIDQPAVGMWYGARVPAVINAMKSKLPPDGSPLWLSFGTHLDPTSSDRVSPRVGPTVSRPSGFLSALSWEKNLVPQFNRPVLRMQGLPLRPLTQHQTLHIAICCSFSAAKQVEPPQQTLDRVFKQIPQLPGQEMTLHVFADLELQPLLKPLPGQLAHVGQVKIYDPQEAAKYGDAERSRTVDNDVTQLESPWLLWMSDSLKRVGVDAVQFVTHGYMSRGHGSLAFAESPMHNSDRRWARFVGTRQISMLLDQLGAWSALLVSPLANFSVAGLRVLQEELTDSVAGPLVLYEMEDDPQRQDLRSVYEYLFGAGGREVPRAQSIALYTHPDWTRPFDADEDLSVQHLVQEYTLAKRLESSFASRQEVPSWIASSQRSLEKAVAKLTFAEPDTDASVASQEGRQDALRFAADLFAKYAAKDTGTEATSPHPLPDIVKEL